MIQLNLKGFLAKAKDVLLNAWRYRAIILSFVVVFLIWLYYNKEPNTPPQDTGGNLLLRDSLRKERATNGQLFATITQQAISKEEAEKRAAKYARLLKIKPKQIKGMTVYTTSIDTVFIGDTVYLEKTQNEVVTYRTEHHDAWVDIVARINKDTGTIGIQIRDTPVVVFSQRNPLFGKSTVKASVYSPNPYISQGRGSSYEVKTKEPILVIGPSVNWNPFTQKFDIGVAATVPIIKIKK